MTPMAATVTLEQAQAAARRLVEDADRLDRCFDELERTVAAKLGQRQIRVDLDDIDVWVTCARRGVEKVEMYIKQTKERNGWHD